MPRRAGCIIMVPLVVGKTLIEYEYLIIHQPSSGFWGFPKGHLIEGETPEQGALREVMEETGLTLDMDQLGKCIRCKDSKFYIVVLNSKPSVKIDNYEIDDYQWLYLNQLNKLPISMVTKQLIKKINNHLYDCRVDADTNIGSNSDRLHI